jgi:Domain of unknown function (DUF2703)
MTIDFLFIDLETCTRCKGTDVNLEAAIQEVQRTLESPGVDISLRKILVETESQALELGFVSSPTIRVNGEDVALELHESSCASCGEACGCEGEINCRAWIYKGEEHTVAPIPMIVDAVLQAVYDTERGVPEPRHKNAVPENLKRFFAARMGKLNREATVEPAASACCSGQEQATCCDPSQKLGCCGATKKGAPIASCGCR